MDYKQRATDLAKQLGTTIPSDIQIDFWMLPILEEIYKQLKEIRDGNTSNDTAQRG